MIPTYGVRMLDERYVYDSYAALHDVHWAWEP